MCTMQQVNLWEVWHCWPLRVRDLHHCERHAISCRMAVSDLNLVVIWSLCDLLLRSTGNFGFWFDILPKHWALCFAARCALRGCLGIRYTVRSVILSFWTPIRLGCLDGNCHCPCTIGCGRQLSWRPGTILGTWCSIGKHFFNGAWSVWPLLPMYIIVSIFIYGSWIWTLHYDWDFWFPSWYL